jgi:TonB family protein
MKLSILGLAIALALSPVAASAQPEADRQAQRVYTYALQLDGDGSVARVTPFGAENDAIGRDLAERVGGWLFSTRGSARAGGEYRTYLRLVVAPRSEAAVGYELVSATTGPAPEHLVLPLYPPRDQMEGRQGTVVMKLDIGADGSVRSAEVHDVEGNVSRNMANAARKAASSWRFATERVDSTPVASTVLWPVCFLGAASTATDCAWSGPEAQRYSSKTVVALDPVAELVTPLALEGR